jgi:hypothetical protein
MLDEKNKKIKAENITFDSDLLHKEFPKSKGLSVLSTKEAEFLGMMVGDGSISENCKGFFSCNDQKIMEEFEELWSRVAQGSLSIKNYNTEYGSSTRASLVGNSSYLRYIQQEIYTRDKYKKVPDRILNAPENIQHSFLEGYNKSDGLKSNPCTYKFKHFKSNSIILAQGLIFLINQTTEQDFNITFESDEKYYGYYSINLLSPVDNLMKEDKVKELVTAGAGQREINRKTGISRDFIRKIQNGG